MLVHIVISGCTGDSYKSIILATLDEKEAKDTVDDYNRRHPDPYDVQYDLFTVPLKGLPELRREVLLAKIAEKYPGTDLDKLSAALVE